LLFIYRHTDDFYTIISSEVYYNEFLNYLDWKSGKVQLENEKSEIDFESELKIMHLPIDVLGILSEDLIGWLRDKVKNLQLNSEAMQNEDWPSFHFQEE
jgi:hypothetical protein